VDPFVERSEREPPRNIARIADHAELESRRASTAQRAVALRPTASAVDRVRTCDAIEEARWYGVREAS